MLIVPLTLKSILFSESISLKDVLRELPKYVSFNARSNFLRSTDPEYNQVLGVGSGREVWSLDANNKVLKLAMNEKGVAQNNFESEFYKSSKHKDILAKTYLNHNSGEWLISEKAVAFESKEDFEKETKLELDDLVRALSECSGNKDDIQNMITFYQEQNENQKSKHHNLLKRRNKPIDDNWFFKEKLENKIKYYISLKTNVFFNRLCSIAPTLESNINDLGRFNSYGKTADGRVVIIDYGLGDEVWANNYYWSPYAEANRQARAEQDMDHYDFMNDDQQPTSDVYGHPLPKKEPTPITPSKPSYNPKDDPENPNYIPF